MGIQYLNRIIRTYASRGVREIPLRSLKGKTLAVDTSIYLYRYQAEEALIENMYLMISLFRHHDITPVFVFDGEPPAEKRELLEERKRDKEEAKERWLELEKELNSSNKNDDEDKINEIIEDKIYGRGSTDMKCGTSASIWTYIILNKFRTKFSGKLTLTCVSD